jgi:hypothetical protein
MTITLLIPPGGLKPHAVCDLAFGDGDHLGRHGNAAGTRRAGPGGHERPVLGSLPSWPNLGGSLHGFLTLGENSSRDDKNDRLLSAHRPCCGRAWQEHRGSSPVALRAGAQRRRAITGEHVLLQVRSTRMPSASGVMPSSRLPTHAARATETLSSLFGVRSLKVISKW